MSCLGSSASGEVGGEIISLSGEANEGAAHEAPCFSGGRSRDRTYDFDRVKVAKHPRPSRQSLVPRRITYPDRTRPNTSWPSSGEKSGEASTVGGEIATASAPGLLSRRGLT